MSWFDVSRWRSARKTGDGPKATDGQKEPEKLVPRQQRPAHTLGDTLVRGPSRAISYDEAKTVMGRVIDLVGSDFAKLVTSVTLTIDDKRIVNRGQASGSWVVTISSPDPEAVAKIVPRLIDDVPIVVVRSRD